MNLLTQFCAWVPSGGAAENCTPKNPRFITRQRRRQSCEGRGSLADTLEKYSRGTQND